MASFETCATSRVDGPTEGSFDVVLANPPYFAGGTIARLFIERRACAAQAGRPLLSGDQAARRVGDLLLETFEHVEAFMNRGYTILCNGELVGGDVDT